MSYGGLVTCTTWYLFDHDSTTFILMLSLDYSKRITRSYRVLSFLYTLCHFRRKKGNTNIDAALRSAIGLFTNHRGFAKDKEIYLISDGKWNKGKDPQKSLKKLKKLAIKISVFGIGANPNREDLEDIAGTSCKKCYHKLKANDESQKRLMRILTRQKGILQINIEYENVAFCWEIHIV